VDRGRVVVACSVEEVAGFLFCLLGGLVWVTGVGDGGDASVVAAAVFAAAVDLPDGAVAFG